MPSQNLPRRLLCAAILATIGSQPAAAAKPDSPKTAHPLSCPDTPALPIPTSNLAAPDTGDDRIHAYADRVESKLDETARFSGNVELWHGGLHLFADEAIYDLTKNTLDASGHIHLSKDSGQTIVTPLLRYELDTERGSAEDAQFAIAGNAARGSAARIQFEGRDVLKLKSVRYTTCPPGRDDWILRASEITLDKSSETGTAWNASIRFMQVPIFYSPYLTFPLTDARKTGFLTPHVGQSNNLGFFLNVPYYFNLAPNYDDTITLRLLGKHGAQALNEFRYLGANFSGGLNLEYLPNDMSTGTDREALAFRHAHTLSPLWSASTDIQWASDSSYFIDLGSSITESARTHLPRSLRLDYGDSIWRFSARAFTYQTLDITIPLADEPYQRLPQLILTANSPNGPNRPHGALESEWVNFYRQDSVTGQRLDLQPSMSLPLHTAYFYFTPKAAYRYTSWRLDNTSADESPDRGLPIYSLDSGLAFEREGRLGGQAYTQTLEPRVYYIYIPYKNQDSLPVFDAALPAFSFYNFFRENRFTGADRVGDANQLTAAVTSRFLLPGSGVEQARVSFGQVQYFADQQVNLPPGTVTQTRSDLIGEATARLGQPWYVRAGVQWDNKESEMRRSSYYLHYRPQSDRIVNLGYRYTNDLERLVDISAQWPLSTRWTGVARWNYSLPESLTVQAYAGLQYASCCWAIRTIASHRQQPDGSVDNSVLFEFELSGFAKMGETEESPLKQGTFIFE
ncbi:MAG TPA: LPS-assembly protein LptD [Acidiferrobacterales bacterium]|nr:LPS-assembly protein LptD [Acidiferrobacterales bacterium]